jgi:hypothetical protein
VKGEGEKEKEKGKSEKEKVENLKFKIHTFLQQRDYYLLEKVLSVAFGNLLSVAFENLRQHVCT